MRSVVAGTMAVGTLALYLGLAKASGANFTTLVDGIASQIEIDVPRVHSYLDFLAYENALKDDGTDLVPDNHIATRLSRHFPFSFIKAKILILFLFVFPLHF